MLPTSTTYNKQQQQHNKQNTTRSLRQQTKDNLQQSTQAAVCVPTQLDRIVVQYCRNSSHCQYVQTRQQPQCQRW